jgi:radical SAM protein with 4Fe4S-binding SPASM domain
MQIEPTTRCDLACRFCPRTNFADKGEDLSLDAFRAIVDRNPYVVAILLQGLGEPLLNSELEEIVCYGRSKGIYVGTCTNGMHLNADRIERLMASGLNYLAISVDGVGEVFEEMRCGGRFDLLLTNLAELGKGGKRGCVIAFWMTLSQQNLDQVQLVLDLARESGVNHVHFQDLQYKQDPAHLQGLSISNALAEIDMRAFVASARRKAAQEGIVSTFDPLAHRNVRTHCRWPWERLYVDCKGDVWPCCVAWTENEMMGNLLERTLTDIWNGSSYGRFRLSLRDGPLPRVCKECRFL